jgi:hypothetical protein
MLTRPSEASRNAFVSTPVSEMGTSAKDLFESEANWKKVCVLAHFYCFEVGWHLVGMRAGVRNEGRQCRALVSMLVRCCSDEELESYRSARSSGVAHHLP